MCPDGPNLTRPLDSVQGAGPPTRRPQHAPGWPKGFTRSLARDTLETDSSRQWTGTSSRAGRPRGYGLGRRRSRPTGFPCPGRALGALTTETRGREMDLMQGLRAAMAAVDDYYRDRGIFQG